MTRVGGSALVALTLLASLSGQSRAQDTAAVVRHLLALDISKVQPYRRSYDMIVRSRDSTIVLGQRDIMLDTATYAGSRVWLLIETRTGIVPAVESLYIAPDMRPAHWSSVLGAARLGVEFAGDSIYGATTTPVGRQNIVLGSRPDLMVSGPMVEALLPLLPLTANWIDSVGVLVVDLATSQIVPAELAVIGEEQLPTDSTTARPTWVLALRAGPRHVLYWLDKETGVVLRVQQPVPAHVGQELEYRMRPELGAAPLR